MPLADTVMPLARARCFSK